MALAAVGDKLLTFQPTTATGPASRSDDLLGRRTPLSDPKLTVTRQSGVEHHKAAELSQARFMWDGHPRGACAFVQDHGDPDLAVGR